MNYCTKCESYYQQPGTCNCFAPPASTAPIQPWTPIYPPTPPLTWPSAPVVPPPPFWWTVTMSDGTTWTNRDTGEGTTS